MKLYSSLAGELVEQEYSQPEQISSHELASFQDAILQGIEDELMPEEAERGLMLYFDGSNAVNEKVLSAFPTVEEVDGRLYGVTVCQISGTLSPSELNELKEYCAEQYADGWGAGFEQRPRRTTFGELYVTFWPPKDFFILTKEEFDTVRASKRVLHHPHPKRGGKAG